MSAKLLKEVESMLSDFNRHFAYLHGKSTSVDLQMPDAAVCVWLNVYEELSPTERKMAIASIYENYTFHPTPAQFREAVRGNEDGEALENWIEILAMLRMSPQDACKRLYLLTSYGRRALTIVGGIGGLGMATESSLHSSIRASYVSAYKALKTSKTAHTPVPIPQAEEYSNEPIGEQVDPAKVHQAIAALAKQFSR